MRLPGSKPRGPPACVVATLWLSRIAAVGVTLKPPARPPHQSSDDPVPPACVAPGIEIALDRRVGRELAGQRPPLAARREDVKDRLDDASQIDCPRTAQSTPGWQPPRDQPPFRI